MVMYDRLHNLTEFYQLPVTLSICSRPTNALSHRRRRRRPLRHSRQALRCQASQKWSQMRWRLWQSDCRGRPMNCVARQALRCVVNCVCLFAHAQMQCSHCSELIMSHINARLFSYFVLIGWLYISGSDWKNMQFIGTKFCNIIIDTYGLFKHISRCVSFPACFLNNCYSTWKLFSNQLCALQAVQHIIWTVSIHKILHINKILTALMLALQMISVVTGP